MFSDPFLYRYHYQFFSLLPHPGLNYPRLEGSILTVWAGSTGGNGDRRVGGRPPTAPPVGPVGPMRASWSPPGISESLSRTHSQYFCTTHESKFLYEITNFFITTLKSLFCFRCTLCREQTEGRRPRQQTGIVSFLPVCMLTKSFFTPFYSLPPPPPPPPANGGWGEGTPTKEPPKIKKKKKKKK